MSDPMRTDSMVADSVAALARLAIQAPFLLSQHWCHHLQKPYVVCLPSVHIMSFGDGRSDHGGNVKEELSAGIPKTATV